MEKSLKIMGILNVTPDSFSDGGQYCSVKNILKRAEEMISEGVDIIDIGGESSGPGSKDISESEEMDRVLPAIQSIKAKHPNTCISVDTYKSVVAAAAIKNGAEIINDITALRGDSKMAKLIAEKGVKVVLMYSKDQSARTTIQEQDYKDIMNTIKEFFKEQIRYAKEQGIKEEQIILDPGMGHFLSSKAKYSLEVIARLKELESLGYPVLIGISRKSFLGGELEERDEKALPVTAIAYLNGASIIRTHRPGITKKYLSNI